MNVDTPEQSIAQPMIRAVNAAEAFRGDRGLVINNDLFSVLIFDNFPDGSVGDVIVQVDLDLGKLYPDWFREDPPQSQGKTDDENDDDDEDDEQEFIPPFSPQQLYPCEGMTLVLAGRGDTRVLTAKVVGSRARFGAVDLGEWYHLLAWDEPTGLTVEQLQALAEDGAVRGAARALAALLVDPERAATAAYSLALLHRGVGAAELAALVACARSGANRAARRLAVEALARSEEARTDLAVEGLLLDLLADPDWQLREAAAHALGQVRPDRAGGFISELLRDKQPEVRWTAMRVGEVMAAAAARPFIPPDAAERSWPRLTLRFDSPAGNRMSTTRINCDEGSETGLGQWAVREADEGTYVFKLVSPQAPCIIEVTLELKPEQEPLWGQEIPSEITLQVDDTEMKHPVVFSRINPGLYSAVVNLPIDRRPVFPPEIAQRG